MQETVKSMRRRRPRGSLSRGQVVEAALELADAEGLGALTMPTLARRLDCGVMTLYGYVEGKEDLLDAIAERGLADLRLPRPLPEGAQQILLEWGRALRRNLIAHPSLPMVFLSRPVVRPGILHGLEALLGPLAEAGMPPAVGVRAVYAVLTYTTGFVAWELPRTLRQPQAAYAAGWRREVAGLPPEELPLVAGVLDQLPEVAGQDQFELGLAALAAGLAASPCGSPKASG